MLISGCAAAVPNTGSGDDAPGDAAVVHVPDDVETISEAVAMVEQGGLVLVGPGTYTEQVLVDRPDVTVRGLDRNNTVIDAEGLRPYGIVAVADGVSIENLTVTGATFYGVLVTGLHDESGPTAHGVDGYSTLDPEKFPPVARFSIDHVTAYNNGLYGLYAFDARHGVIRDSYASGSADSGIYVGQCEDCDIHVTGNVAESNAVGFENANASDSVYVVANRFSGNRVGMTFLSNYQEAFSPQRANAVVGNLVADNAQEQSPAQADGAFGIGIGISGGTNNVFERNRITGNPHAGVVLDSTEDLAAVGNLFVGTAFGDNGIDIVNISGDRAPARDNCSDTTAATILPADLFTACETDAAQPSADLPGMTAPAGMSFLRVAAPPAQPNMPDLDAPARTLPKKIGAPDLASVLVPDGALLADRAR